MIKMYQRLMAHMAWADDGLLDAIASQEGASTDEDMRKLLHHIVAVQRFFLSMFQSRSFDFEREWRVPETMDEIRRLFREAHADGIAYAAQLDEGQLAVTVHHPRFKEFHPAVGDALMQVIMHGEHHRAQCASRLRAMGGKPPVLDYILWVREVGGKTQLPTTSH